MQVFALDLAVRTGFAVGAPGACPRSGVVTLKRPGELPAVAFSNLIAFLNDQLGEGPDLIVKEAALPLQGFKDRSNSAAAVILAYGMHAIVEGMAGRFGIRVESVAAPTIRKHFIGRAKLGDRRATKHAVIDRCHLLKLMPRECVDDNRADALATWDFACATFGRRSFDAPALRLFGERPPQEQPFA
jgi:hypothetical protein